MKVGRGSETDRQTETERQKQRLRRCVCPEVRCKNGTMSLLNTHTHTLVMMFVLYALPADELVRTALRQTGGAGPVIIQLHWSSLI